MAGGIPVLGNALDMAADVLGFLVKQYHLNGPIFRIRVMSQSYTVLAGRVANMFFAREGSRHFRSKEFWEGLDAELGADISLIGSDGEAHARLRQLQKRGYAKSVAQQHIPEIIDLARRYTAQWPVGESRPALDFFQQLVTDQIGTIVLGEGPGEAMGDIRTFIRTALLVLVTRQRPGILLLTPAYRKAKRNSLALGKRIVDHHRRNPPITRQPNLVDDALAFAQESDILNESDLMPIALGPYIAGLDTAASTLAFLFYALNKHANVLEAVRAESQAVFAQGIPTPADLRSLDSTHRAVLETMRRYPIAPALQRTVIEPFTFAGYRVDAGGRIFLGTTVAHFLPELYPDPYQFDIDRYLAPRKEHKTPGAYAPFGQGSHTCLGAGLAEILIMLTASTLLQQARFAIDPPEYQLKIRTAPTPSPGGNFRLKRIG